MNNYLALTMFLLFTCNTALTSDQLIPKRPDSARTQCHRPGSARSCSSVLAPSTRPGSASVFSGRTVNLPLIPKNQRREAVVTQDTLPMAEHQRVASVVNSDTKVISAHRSIQLKIGPPNLSKRCCCRITNCSCPKVIPDSPTPLPLPPCIEYKYTHHANVALWQHIEQAMETSTPLERDHFIHYVKVFSWLHARYPLTNREEPLLLQTLLHLYQEALKEAQSREKSQRICVIAKFIHSLLKWVPLETWSTDLRNHLVEIMDIDAGSERRIAACVDQLQKTVERFHTHQNELQRLRLASLNKFL